MAQGAPVADPADEQRPQNLLDQKVLERVRPQLVSQVRFGLLSGDDIRKLSHLNVTSKVAC